MRQDILRENYKFSQSGIYVSCKRETQQDYLNYIDQLPIADTPEVFHMNDNADITNAENNTRIMLQLLMSIQPKKCSNSTENFEMVI